MNEREAFEKELLNKEPRADLELTSRGFYQNPLIEARWEGWQAALASQETVAWMLKTGHGDKLEFIKPDCLVDKWQPLYTSPQAQPDLRDASHLEWIYNRLLKVHNEKANYDYMIKFKAILDSAMKAKG
jgi:hypothetical protein